MPSILRSPRMWMAVIATSLITAVTAAVTAERADAFTCRSGSNFALRAALPWDADWTQNTQVSAEIGYTGGRRGMLRARAPWIQGTWERFRMHCLGGGQFAFLSIVTGLYVSAELGYRGGDNGMLRARAAAIGPWEKFTFKDLSPENSGAAFGALRSVANNRYVSSERTYRGGDRSMLRARATSIRDWEEFTITWLP